jgi:small conductance mechanosensitive channel
MSRQYIDPTVIRYIQMLSPLCEIILVIAILGFFGVQTTSLAALIAAAGVAIGVAWSGVPANFAAGIFLVILQPFKVGDFVVAGGVTGTVEEVGLFVTSVNTLDNIRNLVGNGRIFGDITQNFKPIRIGVSIRRPSWTIPSMFTLPSPLSKPTWPRSLMC